LQEIQDQEAEMIMKRYTWPAELTLNLIGGKWKALILHRLLEGESRRFGELKRLLPGISAKMLAKHLKELEFDGLLARLEVPVTSGTSLKPRILYTPTSRSRSLAPILDAILSWGQNHLVEYGAGESAPAGTATAGSVPVKGPIF
jgi:DNA-binding HxlR family transcriptional regulator